MANDTSINEFPEISSKLAAPTKKSLFERQKAEAEAKRQREEAETAAVYEDFVKSFEDADEPLSSGNTKGRPGEQGRFGGDLTGPGRGGGLGGPPRRHFAAGLPTGPAGRGAAAGFRGPPLSGPGSLGPPPNSLSRKRALDHSNASQREGSQGLFAFEDAPAGPVDPKAAFRTSEDEEEEGHDERSIERMAPKPTVQLSNLPPGTSPAVIKALLPENMAVDAVRIRPPSGPASAERKSLTAIVTLAKDTPANDIDTAVSGLQNRYLGWGHNLSISRHLSSAALNVTATIASGPPSALSSLPFGARPVPTGPAGPMNRAPPPSSIHRGGYAPPSSYNNRFGRGPPLVQVSVQPPSDLKQLKLVHKTLEALLTHGPEFEALLMTRPDVQRDKRWAWLWDPRSAGGVWYRWRLWQILSGSRAGSGYGRDARRPLSEFVFDGGAAWTPPPKGLRFEYTTRLDEFVSDSDYDSSEDDESGDEEHQKRQHHNHGGPPPTDFSGGTPIEGEGKAYLNPFKKAKLTHLLARLPITNAKLRKGDVARVTAFAIEHAGQGADEVVDLIVSNISQPFSFTSANPDYEPQQASADEPRVPPEAEDQDAETSKREKEDTSPAKLIALYLVSDILSSSSTSGVRHAWRYRQLFEAALKRRKTFERLGRLEKDMSWGRLRAEKWKRSVSSVLQLWEGWCVFPQASQEHFAAVFADPPLTDQEKRALKAAEASSVTLETAKSKWKAVDVTPDAGEDISRPLDLGARPASQTNGDSEDVDGEEMVEEGENLDGEPMEDDDLDGEPMEDGMDAEPMEVDSKTIHPPAGLTDAETLKTASAVREAFNARIKAALSVGKEGEDMRDDLKGTEPPTNGSSESHGEIRKRRRPKAEDMFADSDED